MTIAVDRNTSEIEAIAGFICCSKGRPDKKDVWGSFWKVNEEHKNVTFLGIELMRRQLGLINCREHLGIGVNPITNAPIRRTAFKEKVQKMQHYYILNALLDEYHIAKIISKREGKKALKADVRIKRYDSIDDIKKDFNIEELDAIPFKDFWYINKRYYNHPYYKYQIYGIDSGEVDALLVVKEVEVNGSKVLRIVDYIGNQERFSLIGNWIQNLMKENLYEYVDFYTWGFEEKYIYDAGFILKDEVDENIIPNYFEPFLQKNVDIWVKYNSDKVLFCKADGDQDRPNVLREK